MNERTNGPSSPQRSPRRSPLSSPREKSFAEKRALFDKMHQSRIMQQKLKAAAGANAKAIDEESKDVQVDLSFNPTTSEKYTKKLLPPRTSPKSAIRTTTQLNDELLLDNVLSDETQENSTASTQFFDAFPPNNNSSKLILETISSSQNIFIQRISNDEQASNNNSIRPQPSEEEFSEVFNGQQLTSIDLTKRVLDRSLQCVYNNNLREGALFDDGNDGLLFPNDSFENDTLNSPAVMDQVPVDHKGTTTDGDQSIHNAEGRDLVESSDKNEIMSVDSFKSCKSDEGESLTVSNGNALLAGQRLGQNMKEEEKVCAEANRAEVQQPSFEMDDQPHVEGEISTDASVSDAPRSSPIDSKLKRRHRIASRVASGKFNLPKSFLSAAATSANKVADLPNETKIFICKGSSSPNKSPTQSKVVASLEVDVSAPSSPSAQQESDEVSNVANKGMDELNISHHSHGDLSSRSMESTVSGSPADAPRSSPVDPKLKRRHRMASRVASGKVNVPRSFLSAAATSANKVADLQNEAKINVVKATEQNNTDDTKQQVAKPTIQFAASGKPNEDTAKPNITAVANEQSVELHASLNEFLDLSRNSACDSPVKSLSNNASATLSQESSPEGNVNTLDVSDESGKNTDKNEARRQRRLLRKRDVSITKSLDEEKSSKDLLGVVDEDEAKMLFPMPSFDDKEMLVSANAHESMPPQDCPVVQESAWDERTTSNLDIILEQSKSHSRNNHDGKPLLELDSDPSLAVEKLLSQRERMTMYTGGGGFGVGDDSSVELHDDKDEGEIEVEEEYDDQGEYQTVDDCNEDVDGACSQQDTDTFDFVEFGKGSHEEFSAAGSSAVHTIDRVFDQNGDAILDIGKRSDYFDDTNSSTMGGGTVLGLRFIGSNDESLRSRPTPPGSPADIEATPRIGNKYFTSQLDKPKLFKIAPPPPEKLRQWEENRRGLFAFKPPAIAGTVTRGASSPEQQEVQPMTPKNAPPSTEKVNLKISTPPKSPSKKKHSITEELNLSSQTKMAEKFAIASGKAAKKFEEKYCHIEHDINYGPAKSPERKGGDRAETNRFFCADSGIPFIPSSNTAESENIRPFLSANAGGAGQGVVELVGGAFEPWKIPDRDSNASSRIYDDESYVKASAAALHALHINSESDLAVPLPDDAPEKAESFDARLDLANGGVSATDAGSEYKSSLSEVLLWLFNEVLPSNAFSAFDIDNTSSSVLARRVLAIANDDLSLNLICQHVTNMAIIRHGNLIGSPEKKNEFPPELTSASSSGDLSASTCESSVDSKSSFSERAAARILKGKKRSIDPFSIPISNGSDARPPGEMLAANFISFLQQISYLTGVMLPFDQNPFLQSVVNLTTKKLESKQGRKTMQELVFDSEEKIVKIFIFLKTACGSSESRKESLTSIVEADEDECMMKASHTSPLHWKESLSENDRGSQTLKRSNKRKPTGAGKRSEHKESSHQRTNLNLIVPKTSPSPFETAVWNDPSIMLSVLSFLGNPVSVCVVKRLNVFCNRLVSENEHVLMRDAVRLGGMSKFVRPSFWLWVTTERCAAEDPIPLSTLRSFSTDDNKNKKRDFISLKDAGASGKWHHIIERDVLRAFGNMPPHKTGAKYRNDSIVRALVSFGKEEIMRNSRSYQTMDKLPEAEARHFKLSSRLDHCAGGASDDSSETPTDTVSDWGAISPVGSMISEEPSAATSEDGADVTDGVAELLEVRPKPSSRLNAQPSKSDVCDPVLSGNALTNDMKLDLQNKLRSVLHALAAQHEGLGYCQGMDYVVAHLLRVLQDTILMRVVQGSMPMPGCSNLRDGDWKKMPAEQLRSKMNEINSDTMVVDEVVFNVMDTLFTTYSLQHMYWPELRCLKTCCRVFESLIKQKLPVLADHFEHHDLNVGLFALGWFQTLFLYLPSMPSATVCHMWDIWLVERSFKIFFRVGTAILFLSQPTLLNHDLEGMMTYLNTFPDATLLRRDILIPCALQIKITNSMLVEIEMDVTNFVKF